MMLGSHADSISRGAPIAVGFRISNPKLVAVSQASKD
jgi:hypothetical protein